ncbi:MAG: hypothetical protein K0A99_10095 [Desulfoarculaceae bacterium]|nr:hypothetical protein [Desulfoarculaceae bacterium]
MNKILFFLLAAILVTTTGYAAPQPVLTQISKGYSSNNIQLYCSFSSIPAYTINHKEKRIDLALTNTLAAADLTLPETDSKIVKILSQTKNKTTTISFFFRYPPQKVKVTPQQETNKLVLDILLGNEFTATRPVLAEKLQGMSAIQRQTRDFSNPINASPYPGQWENFFREYEAEIGIEPAVQFSLVPFPAITLLPPDQEKNIALLPSEIMEGAKLNQWNKLLPLIVDLLNKENDQENKKKLTLTYGDILCRSGNFKEAYRQFHLVSTEYGTEPVGLLAKYLLLRLQAEHANLYLADIELQKLESAMDEGNPARPYLLLTRIETALATRQFARMRTLLTKEDISFPAGLAPIMALRQADYWWATGDFIKAHAAYQLLEKSAVLTEDLFSLNGYCGVLYHHKQFAQAADCYDRLAQLSSAGTREHLDMISFRKAMAKLHATPGAAHESDMADDFSQIETTYPGTEAGARAALKQTDLKLLTLKNWGGSALTYYQPLAENPLSRSIREEASFKEALVYQMLGRKTEATERLMTFLRDFQAGELHNTALALLIEILPDILKEHIKNGRYTEALVLAKQNRYLFVKNWIDISLLADMGEAYRQLGFFNEATKMYTYLLDVSTQEDQAVYYLPLIKLVYEQGDFGLVEEYADQYSYHYPTGQDRLEVLYLRVQSLMTQGRYKKALSLLSRNSSEDTFNDPRFKLLQASLSFHLNDYAKARTILEELQTSPAGKQPEFLFMLAESSYQLGDITKAEEFFLPLQQEGVHKDQALFRLAEIAWTNGRKESALKLFTRLVETGDNPRWQNLAKKELELITLFR